MSWTDERVEFAKKLYINGLSASQIATELGGITRNAVIGKIHRGGWSRPAVATTPRPPGINRARHRANLGAPTRRMTGSLAPPPKVRDWSQIKTTSLDPDEIPRHQRRSFDRLREQHCKFPYGNPGTADFFFCGALRHNDKIPYCQAHCRVAYIPAPKRRPPYIPRSA